MVLYLFSIITGHPDQIRGYIIYHTRLLCHHTDTWVNSCLGLHTGSHNRSFGSQKWYGLSLHVGSHQCTVRIIVLQEGDQGCCHWEYHLGRYVHIIKHGLRILGSFLPVTAGYCILYEMTLFIQKLIRLCHMIIILFIRCHVDYFIRDTRILWIWFINLTVWSFNETILINTRITCQWVDQTDVRTFRRLNWTHTSIVRIMNVSNLESGTVSGQTTRSQCR